MMNDVFLRVNMKFNIALGVQRTAFKKQFYNNLHQLYAYFWISTGSLQVLSHFYELKYLSTLTSLMDNLRITFLITFSMVKYFRIRSKSSVDLVEHIRDHEKKLLEECDDEVEIKIYNEQKKINRNTAVYFVAYGYCTLTFFFLYPLIEQLMDPMDAMYDIVDDKVVYRERPFPFGGEFPYDKYKYYKTTYLFHIWVGIFCCGVSVIPDVFYWALMIYATLEIRILQHRLLNFKELAYKLEAKKNNVSIATIANTMNEDDVLLRYLTECIQYHQVIIKYVTDLNDCICYLILIDCGLTSLIIAVIGFGCILSGFSIKQLAGIEYLSWTVAQSFFFYWYANEISLESLRLQASIWESQWYKCSIKIKKILLFVQLRVQRPLVLFIGPLYPMSLGSMLSILKTGISYLTLLRQVYMDKKDK